MKDSKQQPEDSVLHERLHHRRTKQDYSIGTVSGTNEINKNSTGTTLKNL